MQSYSLIVTLGIGVLSAFILFFVFYKLLRWNNKLAAVCTILLVLGVYIPLAVLDWPGLDVFAIHFAFFVMSGYGLGIITSHRINRQRLHAHLGEEEPEDTTAGWFHWAPASIVGFFLVLAMVDATIITLASRGASADFMARFLPEPRNAVGPVTSVFPGAVANDYQEKYDQFNHYLEQKVAQKALGWTIAGGWQVAPKVDQAAVFSLQVKDDKGQPVTGADVEVQFLRPADQRLDKRFALPEAGGGQYGNQIALDAPGQWSVVVRITRDDVLHEIKGETRVGQAS